MAKKHGSRPQRHERHGKRRSSKQLRTGQVTLLKPIPDQAQFRVGTPYAIRREAINRYLLPTPKLVIERAEIQPDGTVALLTELGPFVIGGNDYRAMLELRLPNRQVAQRQGRWPLPPDTHFIDVAMAAAILTVSPLTVRAWLRKGILSVATTLEEWDGSLHELLDEAIIRSPATQAYLAPHIVAYQRATRRARHRTLNVAEE
jgi:hypothetical protein